MCVQFITIVSLHIYSLLKIRLIFHPKKKKEKKRKGKINIFFLNHEKEMQKSNRTLKIK